MVKELTKRGASERTAQELASKFTADHIEAKIVLHDELRAVNNNRAAISYEKLPTDRIRYRRNIVNPFEKLAPVESQEAA